MPPLHPALVHFPIALIFLAVVADFWWAIGKSERASATAQWSLITALILGGIAIALGYYDMSRAQLSHETHEFVHSHLRIGWTIGILLVVLTIWKWFGQRRPNRPPGYGYLTVAALTLLLTFFQGWFGGEMVYTYGAGVIPAQQGTEAKAQARQRLASVEAFLDRLPGFGEESQSEGHDHQTKAQDHDQQKETHQSTHEQGHD